jgi:aspartate aminotransferase
MGQARLCAPTLEQIGASALYELTDEYYKTTMHEYQRRRDVVYDALQKIKGVVCLKPNGAFYVMAKLPIDDAEKFAKFMLTDLIIKGRR